MTVSRADVSDVPLADDVESIWTRLAKRFGGKRRESAVHHTLWWHIVHWFGHGR